MRQGVITIRRKKEPVIVTEEKARRVKLLRFGNADGTGKAEDDTDIDLGDEWTGKLDQIVSIEIVNVREESAVAAYDPSKDWELEEKKILAQPAEVRGGQLGMFKVSWYLRSGMRADQKEPPVKVMTEAKKLTTDFFKKNPKVAILPSNILEPLLLKAWGEKKGQSLAQSKRISVSTDDDK